MTGAVCHKQQSFYPVICSTHCCLITDKINVNNSCIIHKTAASILPTDFLLLFLNAVPYLTALFHGCIRLITSKNILQKSIVLWFKPIQIFYKFVRTVFYQQSEPNMQTFFSTFILVNKTAHCHGILLISPMLLFGQLQ